MKRCRETHDVNEGRSGGGDIDGIAPRLNKLSGTSQASGESLNSRFRGHLHHRGANEGITDFVTLSELFNNRILVHLFVLLFSWRGH